MGQWVTWVGGPGQFLPGVPASDHDAGSEERAEELVASGLYTHGEPPAEPADDDDQRAAPAEKD